MKKNYQTTDSNNFTDEQSIASEERAFLDSEISDKEAKIKERYSKIPPGLEIQRHIVKTNNIVALKAIAELWQLNKDIENHLIRKGSPEARIAYTSIRKFMKTLDADYSKSAPLEELREYFLRYGKSMDKKAYNICVGIRKLSPDDKASLKSKKRTKEEVVVPEKVTSSSHGSVDDSGIFSLS